MAHYSLRVSLLDQGDDNPDDSRRLTNPPMKLYSPKSNTAALPIYASDPR